MEEAITCDLMSKLKVCDIVIYTIVNKVAKEDHAVLLQNALSFERVKKCNVTYYTTILAVFYLQAFTVVIINFSFAIALLISALFQVHVLLIPCYVVRI